MFLLVPAYPGCPGSKAVKWSLLLLYPRYILNRTWLLSPEIVLILFTRGLPCVQCAKNCPTCKYYTANYRIFLEHQLNSKRFPRAISNSRRFRGLPGVVDILLLLQKFVTVRCAPSAAAAFTQVSGICRAGRLCGTVS